MISIRIRDMVISGIGVVYAVWLMYAAGLRYMLLLTILFAAGIFVFYKAKKEENAAVFTKTEEITAVIRLILEVVTLCMAIVAKIKIL